MRRPLALCLALSAVLALAGCSDDPARSAATSAPAKQPAVTSVPAEKPAGNGKSLSKKKTKAALLTVGDLRTGWAVDSDADDSKRTTEPAGCAAVFDALDQAAKPAAKAEVNFAQGPQVVRHSVASYKGKAEGLVEETEQTLSKCQAFTQVEADGARYEAKLSPLPFPALGDRSLAVRMTATGDGDELVADVILIAVGNNAIGIVAGGPLPVPGSEVQAMARRAVAKLG
jgi:hypothetical protein